MPTHSTRVTHTLEWSEGELLNLLQDTARGRHFPLPRSWSDVSLHMGEGKVWLEWNGEEEPAPAPPPIPLETPAATRVVEFVTGHPGATRQEIMDHTGASDPAIYKLVNDGVLRKVDKHPPEHPFVRFYLNSGE